MFDINKTTLSGEIQSLETFKTNKGMFAMNLSLKTNNRYTNTIPCVSYGPLAEKINKQYTVGTNVIIFGRCMSVQIKDSKAYTIRVVIEKIGEELVVPMTEINNDDNV